MFQRTIQIHNDLKEIYVHGIRKGWIMYPYNDKYLFYFTMSDNGRTIFIYLTNLVDNLLLK